eukprot:g5633.t1
MHDNPMFKNVSISKKPRLSVQMTPPLNLQKYDIENGEDGTKSALRVVKRYEEQELPWTNPAAFSIIFVITSVAISLLLQECAYPIIVSQMNTRSTIVTNEVQVLILNELEGIKDTVLHTSTMLRRKNFKHLPEGDDQVLINTAIKFGIGNLYYGALNGAFYGCRTVDNNPQFSIKNASSAQGWVVSYGIQDLEQWPRRNLSDIRSTSSRGYDPRNRSWYINTKNMFKSANTGQRHRPNWANVYADFSNQDLMTTVSVPIMDPKTNEFQGAVGADINLKSLSNTLLELIKKAYASDIDGDVEIMLTQTKTTSGEIDEIPISFSNQNCQERYEKWFRSTTTHSLRTLLESKDIQEAPKCSNLLSEFGFYINSNRINLRYRSIFYHDFISQDRSRYGNLNWRVYIFVPRHYVNRYLNYAYAWVFFVATSGVMFMFLTTYILRMLNRSAASNMKEIVILIKDYFERAKQQDIHTKRLGEKKYLLARTHFISIRAFDTIMSIVFCFFSLGIIFIWYAIGSNEIMSQVSHISGTVIHNIEYEIASIFNAGKDASLAVKNFIDLDEFNLGYYRYKEQNYRSDAILNEIVDVYSSRLAWIGLGLNDGSCLGVEIIPSWQPYAKYCPGLRAIYAVDNSTGYTGCDDEKVTFRKVYPVMDASTGGKMRNLSFFMASPLSRAYDTLGRAWFVLGKEAHEEGKSFVWSNPYLWTYEVGITGVAPVMYKKNGTDILGVIAADMYLNEINVKLRRTWNKVASQMSNPVGSIYIVRDNGKLMGVSSGVPILRKYYAGAISQPVEATKICERREKPSECDKVMDISVNELSRRVNDFDAFMSSDLDIPYPNGFDIKVGKGSNTGELHLRVKSLRKQANGLKLKLFTAIGTSSFYSGFGNLVYSYNTISFGITVIAILCISAINACMYRFFFLTSGRRKLDEATKSSMRQLPKRKSIAVFDPDTEEFFKHYRRLLTPIVQKANLSCRKSNEEHFPNVYKKLEDTINKYKNKLLAHCKKLDLNQTKLLPCEKFIKALQHFGFEHTHLEEQLLIHVIDPGKTGTVDYSSLLSDVKSNVKIVEPVPTLAEKTRAMEYILLSQNANCNILNYLQFEITGDSTRLAWFKRFHSFQYNLFVAVGILLNLSLAFAEAPASRLNFITKENIDNRRQTVFFLRALSCLFLFVDLAFELWLFRLYKVDKIAFEAGIGLSSRSKMKINPQIIIQCSLFLFFVIDLFSVYLTGVKNGDTANKQIVYLLPYSACFRAVWPIVRFKRLKYTFLIFMKTIERAKIVFLVLLLTLTSFSVMGTALFANRHGFNAKDSFQTVYHGFFTLFTFMISSENYQDVTHPPTLCDGSKDANTLNGGLMTAECLEASHSMFNVFATLTGTFLIVSLVISVFSDTYIRLIAKQRQEDKKISRLALIAAFIMLDKDGSGKLDKDEFLDFFNCALHSGRIFYVDDDIQLSGRNFLDLCEEVLHEMELVYPKGISSVEFAPTKSFASCTPSELFQFLSTLSIDGFPTDYSSIVSDTDSTVEYWRWRGCDYYQEHLRVADHKTHAKNIQGRKQYMKRLNATSKAIKFVSKGIVTLNICVLFGIMIKGYSYIDKILRKAKRNNLRKYPTKIIVKSLEQGKMHISTLDYSYCAEKSGEVKIVYNKAVADPAGLDAAADEHRANSSRWIENFNFDHFMTFLRNSKDSYGFYTTYTSTVLSQFYETATESESIKFYNRRQNNDPLRKSISRQRRRSVGSLNLK